MILKNACGCEKGAGILVAGAGCVQIQEIVEIGYIKAPMDPGISGAAVFLGLQSESGMWLGEQVKESIFKHQLHICPWRHEASIPTQRPALVIIF